MAHRKVGLECSVCGSRNYSVNVSAAQQNQRLALKKFCKHCQKVTLHRQTR
ncbi:50S ribosomal protein L33 [Limosilactobacillus ingluviei]|nr:50S ribosomal protein L33 [Limosilactobacillus ingluviei]MBM6728531.1 50S ribosomal protein L33 [Limosilactobacillus ingluviei]MDO4603705.1 50S ribosomal protein L33 [Limosilactobacillus ingluviei]HJG50421.1 50S ribosomal protein L33 [Limosilactobacillus ingluviei]